MRMCNNMSKAQKHKILYPNLRDFTKFLEEFHFKYYRNSPCTVKGRDIYHKWERDPTCDYFGTQLSFIEVEEISAPGSYDPHSGINRQARHMALDLVNRKVGLVKGNIRFTSYYVFKTKYDSEKKYSKMPLGELQVGNHFLAAVYNIIDDHFKDSRRWKSLPVELCWKQLNKTAGTPNHYEFGLYSVFGALNFVLIDDKVICHSGGWGAIVKRPKSTPTNLSLYHVIELSDPTITTDLGQCVSDLYWYHIKSKNGL